MKKLSIIFVLFALFLAACQSSDANANTKATQRIVDQLTPANSGDSSVAEQDSGSSPQTNNPVIIIARSGGFAGVSEQWSFYSDGHVMKDAADKSQTGETLTVDSAEITSLLEELKSNGFFQMKASSGIGGMSNCKDCFTYQLTATSDGVTNTISFQDDSGSDTDAIRNITNQLIALASK
jgi:hypothetical protein